MYDVLQNISNETYVFTIAIPNLHCGNPKKSINTKEKANSSSTLDIIDGYDNHCVEW